MKPKFIRSFWNQFADRCPRVACDIDLLRKNRYFEKDLWLIPKYCSKDAISIDVGVNEGIFSRWMAKFSKSVEGFECNPLLYSRLKNFLPSNVHLNECALSNTEGFTVLRFDPENTGIGTIEALNKLDQNQGIRSVTELQVPTKRLDGFELGRVAFMKIDVEGHELEVLKGSAGLIERDRPVLLIEIEERHCRGNLRAVPAWLTSFGYKLKILDVERKELSEVASIEEAAENGVNNFWFLPA
jgi:FkbM family methyltransferase